MPARIRAHIFISGLVQGISFRYYTREKAKQLGLTGWVKNLSNGRVEAVFEGEKEKIEQMIDWVKQGPDLAQVKEVEVQWQEYENEFSDFEIRY